MTLASDCDLTSMLAFRSSIAADCYFTSMLAFRSSIVVSIVVRLPRFPAGDAELTRLFRVVFSRFSFVSTPGLASTLRERRLVLPAVREDARADFRVRLLGRSFISRV